MADDRVPSVEPIAVSSAAIRAGDEESSVENDYTVVETRNPFECEISNFIESTDSLSEGFPLAIRMLALTLKVRTKALLKFAEPYITEQPDPGTSGLFKMTIPVAREPEYLRLRRRVDRLEHSIKRLSQSFLVALVSQFDTFIGGLARCVLYARSDILSASERALTFADLVDFKSIEDARESIVEKEIDALLRGSHESQIKWFEERLRTKSKLKDLVL